MRDAIVAHARREGAARVLRGDRGQGGSPVRLYPTRNVAEGNRLYEIDPAQLIDLELRELPEQRTEIIAIYHSHPSPPAYPSATELALAFWPDAVYIICSLEHPEEPVLRGFRLATTLYRKSSFLHETPAVSPPPSG